MPYLEEGAGLIPVEEVHTLPDHQVHGQHRVRQGLLVAALHVLQHGAVQRVLPRQIDKTPLGQELIKKNLNFIC